MTAAPSAGHFPVKEASRRRGGPEGRRVCRLPAPRVAPERCSAGGGPQHVPEPISSEERGGNCGGRGLPPPPDLAASPQTCSPHRGPDSASGNTLPIKPKSPERAAGSYTTPRYRGSQWAAGRACPCRGPPRPGGTEGAGRRCGHQAWPLSWEGDLGACRPPSAEGGCGPSQGSLVAVLGSVGTGQQPALPSRWLTHGARRRFRRAARLSSGIPGLEGPQEQQHRPAREGPGC